MGGSIIQSALPGIHTSYTLYTYYRYIHLKAIITRKANPLNTHRRFKRHSSTAFFWNWTTASEKSLYVGRYVETDWEYRL